MSQISEFRMSQRPGPLLASHFTLLFNRGRADYIYIYIYMFFIYIYIYVLGSVMATVLVAGEDCDVVPSGRRLPQVIYE
jgi:hypothetical protein